MSFDYRQTQYSIHKLLQVAILFLSFIYCVQFWWFLSNNTCSNSFLWLNQTFIRKETPCYSSCSSPCLLSDDGQRAPLPAIPAFVLLMVVAHCVARLLMAALSFMWKVLKLLCGIFSVCFFVFIITFFIVSSITIYYCELRLCAILLIAKMLANSSGTIIEYNAGKNNDVNKSNRETKLHGA